MNHVQELRLDIWLFRCRFYKSRGLAITQIKSGKIRINRNGSTERTDKPNTVLRIGHKLTFMRGSELVNIEILGFPARRGPAAEARAFYRVVPVDLDI